MCPGIHLAERNQWRITAKLLWAFEFSEPIDPATGKAIPIDLDSYELGLLHVPLPYKVHLKPRSQAHIDTIKREVAGAFRSLEPWA
jgi:hypothetical protein